MNSKDTCVIGLGRFGRAAVIELVKMKRHVLAIDLSEMQTRRIAEYATNVAVLDCSDIEGLNALGITQFDNVIVAVGNNVDIIASLTEIGVKNIVARATSERHARVLRQIGVSHVVFPEAEAGARTAVLVTNPAFLKYSQKIEEIGGGMALASVIFRNPNWANRQLHELKFNALKVNVVSVKRNSEVLLPTGKLKLEIGDMLTLIGSLANLARSIVFLSEDQHFKHKGWTTLNNIKGIIKLNKK